jgi:hypothetical protein
MATTTRTDTSATTRDNGPDVEAPRDRGEEAQAIATSVLGAANDAVSRLPEAASSTRGVLADATRTIRAGSDERLSAGTLLSFGFALGLLIGGANRLFVLAALIPAAAMGVTLLDRQAIATRPRISSPTSR